MSGENSREDSVEVETFAENEENDEIEEELSSSKSISKSSEGASKNLTSDTTSQSDKLKSAQSPETEERDEEVAPKKVCEKRQKKRHFRTPCSAVINYDWEHENDALWKLYIERFAESVWARTGTTDFQSENFEKVPQISKKIEKRRELLPDTCFGGRNAFNLRERFNLPENGDERFDVWREMLEGDTTIAKESEEEEIGSSLWSESKENEVANNQLRDLVISKELGPARIPKSCPSKKRKLYLVDTACGEQPGLTFGDYVISKLRWKGKRRTYANVVLRGLEGMQVSELSKNRARTKTWKFCLFQALVALLAKTQLRYRYVWSANIDYIYQTAWSLFFYVGNLKINTSQRFDDILVYNYKYSVELELVHELKGLLRNFAVGPDFLEAALQQQHVLRRKELTLTKDTIGEDKFCDDYDFAIHRCSKKLEDWLYGLNPQPENCILRTSRFSLAYWRDGSFWYLYNPYRCDEFGFWSDNGAAAIVKFCSRKSLNRHLVILINRANATFSDVAQLKRLKNPKSKCCNPNRSDTFDVQIFQLIFHCCERSNVENSSEGLSEKSEITEQDQIATISVGSISNTPVEIEKREWLKNKTISWSVKALSNNPRKCFCRNFDIVLNETVQVLWGNLHITDVLFKDDNRGKQAFDCYIVCAGMSAIVGPECWTVKELDTIVVSGDSLYTERVKKGEKQYHSSTYEFKIYNSWITARCHKPIKGRLYSSGTESLWQVLKLFFRHRRFGVLKCETALVGIFRDSGVYYLCDVLSYGPPIFEHGNGSAYLLRLTNFKDFVASLILLIGSPESAIFSISSIVVLNSGKIEHSLVSK